MKLNQRKQDELTVWEYFILKNIDWAEKTDRDIKMFFEWSEQGLHKDIASIPAYKKEGRTYFHALICGKSWAGRNIHEIWEKDFGKDYWLGYRTILGENAISIRRKWWQFWKDKITFKNDPMPRPVVDFIKKEMFMGADAEVIEECYQDIINPKKVEQNEESLLKHYKLNKDKK